MGEHQAEKPAAMPWRVPVAVEDVPEGGEHFKLMADADARAAVARLAGLRDLPRLEANFEVRRHGVGGLHVAGLVSATVGQTCVVTLEPLVNEVAEEVDLLFVPRSAVESADAQADTADANVDEAEPLVGGSIDLGALATEFLILGLNPYPRKLGAVFAPPQDAAARDDGPFAPLTALKKEQDRH